MRIASVDEKDEENEAVKQSFESAIAKLKAMKAVHGIENMFAKVYGLYGEYLLRQDNRKEGNKHLKIAKKFGYKPIKNVSWKGIAGFSMIAMMAWAYNKVEWKKWGIFYLIGWQHLPSISPSLGASSTYSSSLSPITPVPSLKSIESHTVAYSSSTLTFSPTLSSSVTKIRPTKTPIPTIDPAEVDKFFKLVVQQGLQDEAEAMIKDNRRLLLEGYTINDLSGRNFNGVDPDIAKLKNRIFTNITVFQYATWALDRHMWTMLLKYLPSEQAASQLRETGSWVKTHGIHAGMPGGPLDKLCKAYDSYKGSGYSAEHWQKQIGGAQLLLPAHVVNEYCRPDRSFDPCPKFDELILPRTQKIDEGEWFSAEFNGGKIGDKFACSRSVRRGSACAYMFGSWLVVRLLPGPDLWEYDHAAVVQLTKTRVQELDVLLIQLGLDQQVSTRQRLGAN